MKFRLHIRITKDNAHNNFQILSLLEVLEKQHVVPTLHCIMCYIVSKGSF